MADPIPNPTATPAANPQAGTSTPATTPTPGADQAGKKREFTDTELNALVEDRLLRDRQAREKELGLNFKDAQAIIKAHNAKVEGEKSELDKLREGLTAKDQELAGYKLKDAITTALLDAGCKPDKLNKAALRIIGETPEEIASDVAEYKKENPSLFGVAGGSPGGGHPGVQDTPGAPRVYKASEIRAMSHQERIANEKDILRAMATPGGIIQD